MWNIYRQAAEYCSRVQYSEVDIFIGGAMKSSDTRQEIEDLLARWPGGISVLAEKVNLFLDEENEARKGQRQVDPQGDLRDPALPRQCLPSGPAVSSRPVKGKDSH